MAAAAAVATSAAAAPFLSRKRCSTPFLDETTLRVPKHARFSPSCEGKRPSLEFNPLDALRRIFPDVDPCDLDAGFAASGRDIHATVAAFGARQAKEEASSRLTRAAARADGAGCGMDECAAVLVEHMSAAADLADAKNRASWTLAFVKDTVAERTAAALREENVELTARAASSSAEIARLKEENAGLRAQAASSSAEAMKLREENAALKAQAAAMDRDNAVLKRGVFLLNARQEEAERAAAEMKKKAADLEMANYALGVRLRDADNCRFQAFRGPDAF